MHGGEKLLYFRGTWYHTAIVLTDGGCKTSQSKRFFYIADRLIGIPAHERLHKKTGFPDI